MIQITYNEMGDMMFLRAEGHAGVCTQGARTLYVLP